MRRIIVAGALVLFSACTQRPAESTRAAVVEASGSHLEGGRVGAAALVRSDRDVGPVWIRLDFVGEDGRNLSSTEESLPYCPARQECWWAAGFFTTDVGGSSIREVTVSLTSAPNSDGRNTIESVDVTRDPVGAVTGTASRDSGVVYVVVLRAGEPLWGASVNVTPQLGRSFSIEPDVLPSVDGEELRAYFYAGDGGRRS